MQDEKVRGLGDHVMFIGYLKRHVELNSCYCSADMFIFSSRSETQGLVLLEAMAQDFPVISTGTRDVLQDGSGVWITKEEPEYFFRQSHQNTQRRRHA